MVKKVIPYLKRTCGERNVVLSYVDFRYAFHLSFRNCANGILTITRRWGVTESQNEQAQTLLLCLRYLCKFFCKNIFFTYIIREIQRCNIFIGLYGERYGWSLKEKSILQLSPEDELLKRSIEVWCFCSLI